MKKSIGAFKTNVKWSTDKCEIITYEQNVRNSDVILIVDMKRGQYYVLPSENEKRNLESISRVLNFLKHEYIDKIAAYSDGESLEYMTGVRFNPILDSNGELEKRTGEMVSYSRKVLKVCLDNDHSINKLKMMKNI